MVTGLLPGNALIKSVTICWIRPETTGKVVDIVSPERTEKYPGTQSCSGLFLNYEWIDETERCDFLIPFLFYIRMILHSILGSEAEYMNAFSVTSHISFRKMWQ
jgi:hypothetical protein